MPWSAATAARPGRVRRTKRYPNICRALSDQSQCYFDLSPFLWGLGKDRSLDFFFGGNIVIAWVRDRDYLSVVRHPPQRQPRYRIDDAHARSHLKDSWIKKSKEIVPQSLGIPSLELSIIHTMSNSLKGKEGMEDTRILM